MMNSAVFERRLEKVYEEHDASEVVGMLMGEIDRLHSEIARRRQDHEDKYQAARDGDDEGATYYHDGKRDAYHVTQKLLDEAVERALDPDQEESS